MMAVLFIVLLLALTDAATGLFYKKHVYHDPHLTWSDAQANCRKTYIDLSSFDTEEEFTNFVTQTKDHASEQCWIGLDKKISENTFTQWTDGNVLDIDKWKGGKPDHTDTEHCVFTANNEWENRKCTDSISSFCYTWAPQMIVVQEMMNWEEALRYCRTYHTDLVSLTSETDRYLVNKNSSYIQTPTFWTGLRFINGSWFWVNQDLPETVPSMPSCPASPYRCGALNVESYVWENRDCEEKMNFMCYNNITG